MSDLILMTVAILLIVVSAYSLLSYIKDIRASSFPKKKR
ncbi:small membrane protein [Erwiniaceae bacterium CAU 1747]